MPKTWTAKDLIEMDDAALMMLHSNAQLVAQREKSKLAEPAIALIPLIEAELARRAANRPLIVQTERKAPRSEKGRIERQYADAIVDLVTSLNARFDLSPETAVRLSVGFRKFRPRAILGRNGDALVGGSKLAGRLAIDRYTAYRIKEETVSLTVILEKNAPLNELKFIVQASYQLLADPRPLSTIRSTANDEASLAKGEVGQLFHNFGEAAKFYEGLIAQIAPERPQAS
jgi:hypothetical protein